MGYSDGIVVGLTLAKSPVADSVMVGGVIEVGDAVAVLVVVAVSLTAILPVMLNCWMPPGWSAKTMDRSEQFVLSLQRQA